MSFPVWITVGTWRLHPHLLFESLGYVVAAALVIALRTRASDALRRDQRVFVTAAALVGSVAGSFLLAWPAGKTVVGGLIGGLVGVELVKRLLGITVRTGDLFVFPACVGMALGRVGCFLTGLSDNTHGVGTDWVTAVDFGDGIGRHPTQLYEIVFLLLQAGVLWWQRSRFVRAGELFRAFMMSYLTWRLGVDFLKPDAKVALGLSAIQWAALATLGYYVLVWSAPADDTS